MPALIQRTYRHSLQLHRGADGRRYAAIEAVKLGYGGISYISDLFGCDYCTIRFGMDGLDDQAALSMSSIRRSGGGRKSAFETIAGLDAAFLQVLAQYTAGSPTDETIKWTNLTRQEIAELLKREGITVSVTVVDQLLQKHHYRKHKAVKTLPTGEHPQRNEQFEHIAQLKQAYQQASLPSCRQSCGEHGH